MGWDGMAFFDFTFVCVRDLKKKEKKKSDRGVDHLSYQHKEE